MNLTLKPISFEIDNTSAFLGNIKIFMLKSVAHFFADNRGFKDFLVEFEMFVWKIKRSRTYSIFHGGYE